MKSTKTQPGGRRRRTRGYRQLAAEMLEDRVLLAGDLLHNEAMAADVNADGLVNVQDVLEVVKEMRNGGSSGEGEAGQPMFVDVNGDGFLTVQDVTTVVGHIRGEGAPGDVIFRLETLVNSVVSPTVGAGQNFTLNVFVQDNRNPDTTPGLNAENEKGLLTADVDVSYTTSLADAISATFITADYAEVFAPTINDANGIVDNATGIRADLITDPNPVGPGEVLFYSATFTAGMTLGTVFLQSGLNLPGGNPNTPNSNLYEIPPAVVLPTDFNFGTASIEIVPFSDNDPVANPDTYAAVEDTPLIVNMPGKQTGDGTTNPPPVGVLDNDLDSDQPPGFPDGTTLSALLSNGGMTSQGGTIALNLDGTFTYTPAANFNGVDTFQYIASDGARQSAPTTVTINVAPVPDNPIANDDLYSIPLNGSIDNTGGPPPPGLLDNDVEGDAGDTVPQFLQVTEINGANVTDGQVIALPNGTLTIFADGTFTYTPNAGFVGVETFTYTTESFIAGPTPTGDPAAMAEVNIEVGIEPRDVSGFVYFDNNNNGMRDAGEVGIGGVRVDLTGTDFHGNAVSRTTITNSAGQYRFEMVDPGDYTIHEIQPGIMLDGFDTPGNLGTTAPPSNDTFMIALTGEMDAVDYNFAELGRPAEFYSLADFLASSAANPSLATFDSNGNLLWYAFDPVAWQGITSLSIAFNGDGTVTLTALDNASPTPNTLTSTVAANGDPPLPDPSPRPRRLRHQPRNPRRLLRLTVSRSRRDRQIQTARERRKPAGVGRSSPLMSNSRRSGTTGDSATSTPPVSLDRSLVLLRLKPAPIRNLWQLPVSRTQNYRLSRAAQVAGA